MFCVWPKTTQVRRTALLASGSPRFLTPCILSWWRRVCDGGTHPCTKSSEETLTSPKTCHRTSCWAPSTPWPNGLRKEFDDELLHKTCFAVLDIGRNTDVPRIRTWVQEDTTLRSTVGIVLLNAESWKLLAFLVMSAKARRATTSRRRWTRKWAQSLSIFRLVQSSDENFISR